jgi:glycosyltransferase involved in cell wall biosynthesis
MAKVTIAIAAFNREAYLRDCLQSISQQTFRDFLIIVFDNHSDYNVTAMLASFPDIDIQLEQTSENIGQDRNFQRIYTYSYETPYVLIFHDDDTMHPNLLAEQVAVLDAHAELVWVGTSFSFVMDGQPMNNFDHTKLSATASIYTSGELTRLILSGFKLCFDSLMYRPQFLEDHLYLVKEFSKWSDRPQIITLARKGKVGIINAPLVNYRLHQGQDSVQKVDLDAYIIFGKKLFQFYWDNLPQPITMNDQRLLLRFTTNNLLPALAQMTNTFTEFKQTLQKFQPDFFQWRYLRPKGVYYFMKILKKFYL